MNRKEFYIENDWLTHPVNSKTKEPTTPHGYKDARVGYFGDDGTAVACGRSNLIAIDVDVKDGKTGDKTWSRLVEEHGFEHQTYTVMTPSGGLHYIYQYAGKDIKSARELFPGIDIKSVGGYVLIPPSEGYNYLSGDVLPLPDKLREVLLEAQSKFCELDKIIPGKIEKGARDDTLTSLAGTLRRKGSNAEEILALLQITNKNRCIPPLAEKDLVKIAASISKHTPEDNVFIEGGLTEAQQRLLNLEKTSKHYHETEAPVIKWVIEGILEEGGFAIYYGDSGIGKTYETLYLATCVGSGSPWYDNVTNQKKVVYLDAENGESLIHRRYKQVDPDGKSDISFFSFPKIKFDAVGLELIEWLINYTGTDFLIIDPLMDFTTGDENKIEDMGVQLEQLRELASRTNCYIWTVHHENRQGGYRGTSAFKDKCTLMIHLVEIQKEDVKEALSEAENPLKMFVVKQRESMMRDMTVKWSVVDNIYRNDFISAKSDLDKLLDACQKLYNETNEWPGKTELSKAKKYHSLAREVALTQIRVALGLDLLKMKEGIRGKQTMVLTHQRG